MIYFKRLFDHQLDIPQRGTEFAAGFDLQAAEAATIEPGQRRLIKTGFAVQLPDGHYGRIAPRSGLAYKHGIDIMAGVIDIDYRGDVGCILYNTSEQNFQVSIGDKVAQLIIESCSYMPASESETLSDTVRGEDGYGSTGK